jgi:nitrite reductase/ring-hydroxylating ferredoxin subunit
MITQDRPNSLRRFFRGSFIAVLLVCGCGRDLSDDPIPVANFPDVTFNIIFPEYQPLQVDHGFKLISKVGAVNIGVRGVIVYRINSTSYLAYEVNCSYHPNDAGANVNPNVSGLYMTCAGCGSNFSFTDGSPMGGVAWRPLRRYRTELSGTNLTITSDISN